MKRIKGVIKERSLLIKLIIAMLVMIAGIYLLFSGAFYTYQDIPDNVVLSYKAAEPGAGGFLFYGGVQYYIFDNDGNRYKVSQDTFDSYVDLPRK